MAADSSKNNSMTLIGVAGKHQNCGGSNGTYTRVSHFRNWLSQMMPHLYTCPPAIGLCRPTPKCGDYTKKVKIPPPGRNPWREVKNMKECKKLCDENQFCTDYCGEGQRPAYGNKRKVSK